MHVLQTETADLARREPRSVVDDTERETSVLLRQRNRDVDAASAVATVASAARPASGLEQAASNRMVTTAPTGAPKVVRMESSRFEAPTGRLGA